MKKVITLFLAFLMPFAFASGIMATDNLENNVPAVAEIEIKQDSTESVDGILNILETVLDPENNALEEKAAEIMEKHEESRIVKLFRKIINAIVSFLQKLFAMATEAAVIEG